MVSKYAVIRIRIRELCYSNADREMENERLSLNFLSLIPLQTNRDH
jgi:hypothetical protein